MGLLKIKLETDLSFKMQNISLSLFDRDVFLDHAGFPYIPAYVFRNAVKNENILPKFTMTNARPIGYDVMLSAVQKIKFREANFAANIARVFTKTRNAGKSNLRVLKAGLVFCANIEAVESDRAQIEHELCTVKSLGKSSDSGRVNVSVDWNVGLIDASAIAKKLHAKFESGKKYNTLNYSIQIRSPLCFRDMQNIKHRALSFMPGNKLMEYVAENYSAPFGGNSSASACGCVIDAFADSDIKFTNAYVSVNGKRSVPAPISFTYRKIDKTILCDRLSEGKKADDRNQLCVFGDAYLDSVTDLKILNAGIEYNRVYSKPEVHSAEDYVEGIAEGQILCGSIHGTTEQIEQLYKFFVAKPLFQIGDFCETGCGEVLIKIDSLEEKKTPSQMLSRFDIYLTSPVVMINQYGQYSIDEDDLIAEIEYTLGVKNILEIEKSFSNIVGITDYNVLQHEDEPAFKAINRGSVLRLRTKDGSKVDVSLLEKNIGERVSEGYGEVFVTEAVDAFYRTCESVDADAFKFELPFSDEEISRGKKIEKRALSLCLMDRIDALGRIDSHEIESYLSVTIPIEVLQVLNEHYNLEVADSLLTSWYLDGLQKEIRMTSEYEVEEDL